MRQQWDDSDGYCGSLATQTILLSQGAYVSQDHVREELCLAVTVDLGQVLN